MVRGRYQVTEDSVKTFANRKSDDSTTEAQRSQRSAHGEKEISVSGTVEMLFRIHTDASLQDAPLQGATLSLRDAALSLSRGIRVFLSRRDALDRIWPSPHIRSEPHKAFLRALCASVVNKMVLGVELNLTERKEG